MSEDKQLKLEFPSQGWKQVNTARKAMLSAFDQAKEKGGNRKVKTFHGNVAEAEFRAWLASFLPRRYAVTSGYIVSQGLGETATTPHYDVIIYDAMESPVLWIDKSPDLTGTGSSLAIPCEYVRAVFEVKSSFSSRTVGQCVDHLADLAPLLSGEDKPDERHKLFLHPMFFSGLVFFELLQKDARSGISMNKLLSKFPRRGYTGGVILRGEGLSEDSCGKITIWEHDSLWPPSDSKDLLKMGHSGIDIVNKESYYSAVLTWKELHFAMFAFDVVARLQGTYQEGRYSSR